MTTKEVLLRLAISRVRNLGPRLFLKILEKFDTIESFIDSDLGLIKKNINLSEDFISHIKLDTNLKKAENIIKNVSKYKIDFVVFGQKDYPLFLKEIYDPPIVLFHRGDIRKLSDLNCISIVGTRKISQYGKKITTNIVTDLVQRDFGIISGLAFGIDKLSHEITLQNNGFTAAVLAGDLRVATPRTNQKLFERIIESGVVVSENYIDDDIVVGSFPRRNRIIAGLSMATLVIEAGEKSGALITASQAFKENRAVFAIPGNVDSFNSIGTNNLIKIDKAKLVTSAYDIIKELGFDIENKQKFSDVTKNLDEISKQIIEILRLGPKNELELTNDLMLDSSKLFSILTKLELRGIIERRENGNFYINF